MSKLVKTQNKNIFRCFYLNTLKHRLLKNGVYYSLKLKKVLVQNFHYNQHFFYEMVGGYIVNQALLHVMIE